MATGRTRKQWLADVVAVLSLILPIVFGSFFLQAARISLNPATATGTVRERIFIEGKGDVIDRFLLRYTFPAASGTEYRGQSAVSSSMYQRTAVGDPITIEYAADDPTNSRVRGQFDPLAIEVAGMFLLGLGLFWYLGPRRWLAMRRGEPDPVLSDAL